MVMFGLAMWVANFLLTLSHVLTLECRATPPWNDEDRLPGARWARRFEGCRDYLFADLVLELYARFLRGLQTARKTLAALLAPQLPGNAFEASTTLVVHIRSPWVNILVLGFVSLLRMEEALRVSMSRCCVWLLPTGDASAEIIWLWWTVI